VDANSILVKTDKGAEEIATRKHKLDPKLRTLLITVNGSASAAELARKFAGIGDIAPLLSQLEREGYVRARVDFEAARLELSHAVTALLGPLGDPIAEKIEGCASIEALRAYLAERKDVLGTAFGPRAPQFWSKAEALLG
jgi:hypothetical protein